MGEGEASAPAEPMRDSGQTRKESTGPTTSSSNKSLRIASWNVRTMYEAGKTSQVTNEMRRYKLDILGISETYWIQSGQKRLNSGELILFSGRNDKQHSEGVALILSKLAQKSLRGWEAHGERIMMVFYYKKQGYKYEHCADLRTNK